MDIQAELARRQAESLKEIQSLREQGETDETLFAALSRRKVVQPKSTKQDVIFNLAFERWWQAENALIKKMICALAFKDFDAEPKAAKEYSTKERRAIIAISDSIGGANQRRQHEVSKERRFERICNVGYAAESTVGRAEVAIPNRILRGMK
ncbi:hypothetical protein [Actinobacillus equuli]|uniref:Uncharacterized protein n=1 Tax=Actinobacillus equuli TaxID=718 RepID=A0AAX3FLV3_ACTEU|nr:hypothetical protein [Actinobacillus equuli]AIZ78738.1 hypothetical protein ACEE_02885 [Actinobacillus equuli subsp. equuli]WGE44996.1 hypothetical protein NYR65_02855 [Actinobacillus equuli subsp. equuli]VEE92960.1 Uncharacterised protein [Actinobacillus equuli]